MTAEQGGTRRGIDPAALPIVGTLVFLVIALLSMVSRHYFDDEITNIWIIKSRTLGQVWQEMNHNDVHPPLGYALNWLTWQTGNALAMRALPLLLCLFAVWFFLKNAVPRAEDNVSMVMLTLWTALSPTLLIWGLSIRWYGFWMPLALITATLVLLSPRSKGTLWAVALLSVAMFYLSYITLVFLAALGVVELVRRKAVPTPRVLLAMVAWALVCAPQFIVFVTVHLPASRSQTSRSLGKMVQSMVVGTVTGPSIFPLDIGGLVILLGTLLALATVLLRMIGRKDGKAPYMEMAPFVIVYLVLLCASGLLLKDRNVLVLSVLFFGTLCLALPRLNTIVRGLFVAASTVFLAVSTFNVLSMSNTLKGSLNLPVKEVLQQARTFTEQQNLNPSQVTVFEWDPVLTYYLEDAGFDVLTPPVIYTGQPVLPSEMRTLKAGQPVICLSTGQGAFSEVWFKQLSAATADLTSAMSSRTEARLGPDKSAKLKAKLSKTTFPEYMVMMTAGKLDRDVHVDLNSMADWSQSDKEGD